MPLSDNLSTYSIINDDNSVYCMIKTAAKIQLELAKLIDVQSSELLLLTSAANSCDFTVAEIIAFHKSIQRILKKLCMLQMLLQLKLEYVSKLICINTPKSEIDLAALSAIKEMAKKTKRKLYGLATSFDADKAILRAVRGRAHGEILKRQDSFCRGLAIVQLDVEETCSKDNLVCYSAMKGTKMLNFTAYPNSLITSYEKSSSYDKITMEGMGCIVIKELYKPDKRDIGSFELIIYLAVNKNEKNFFELSIQSSRAEFNQTSGKIEAECSNLQIKTD